MLSLLPSTRSQRGLALLVALISAAIFAMAAPFARMSLAHVQAFIPAYESALVISDTITAALLFGQARTARSRAVLILACAYLFTALMTIAHALSFPGLFTERGLGAGPQTTVWIYMIWHGGFPLAVLGYALLKSGARDGIRTFSPALLVGSIAAVAAAALLFSVLTTAGESYLPEIYVNNAYRPAYFVVVGTDWSLSLAVLIVLWVRKPRSVLDLWLMVVLCAWLCDIGLSAVLNAGRFDLGFYAGRIFGLLAASFVLIVLLLETIALYARLAQALEAEADAREQRLREVESELIHVSRLSELGQRVSAIVHEVNQPIAAITNYLRAGQRFARVGDLDTAKVVIDKAVDQILRISEIVARLRGFLRKSESKPAPENLRMTIEEAVALVHVSTGRHNFDFELNVDPGVSSVFIDRVQIQQVLLNLIRNALEAMEGVSLSETPKHRITIAAVPAAEGKIEVSVADRGPGLAAEVKAKLFQPFVTTKGNGMGVGLSICRTIVEAHQGSLWAEDNPGGGTVFRFTVPVA